ncbi:MAG: MATE family efflux transporter [Christensenellaceae bacterium]
MNKDLTSGKPSSVLWKFCLPLFGSIIFQQLYNIADSFVAGKFIGNDALAAVGNSYEITLIFIAFAFGCNIGCSVVVSNFFGAKKYGEMKTSVYTSLIAGGVLCGVLMLFGSIFCGGLLRLINTPENIFADSKLYLDIYIYGLPFVFFYNIATGIFSALGDSKTPFVFLACSSVANIGMDILFVAAFKMGVAGVAWATFLCQGVSCVLAVLFVVLRLKKIGAGEKTKLFSFAILGKVAVIAVPSILQQSFISVGNIVIQSVINTFGSEVMAGYSAAVKLNNMVVTSLTTLGNGISNYTAQNMGAGKHARVKQGFRAGLAIVWIICVPVCALYLFAGKYLMYAFLDDVSGAALKTGLTFLRVISPFYFVIAAKLVADGVLRGSGMMKQFMIATFTDLILRVALAEVLALTPLGTTGIWMAWPCGWCVSAVLSIIFYRGGAWNKMPDAENKEEEIVREEEELEEETEGDGL